MPTYEPIKFKFSGPAVTGLLQDANNLSDVAATGTSRTKLGVATNSPVQAFISATAGTNVNGNRTVSTNAPSGGSDGDIWYKYT